MMRGRNVKLLLLHGLRVAARIDRTGGRGDECRRIDDTAQMPAPPVGVLEARGEIRSRGFG